MTAVSSASAAVTEGAKVVIPCCKKNGKLRVMCRYGGSVVSLPQTKSLRYVGGDTRIVAVPLSEETRFASLVSNLTVTLGIYYAFKVKYQLPEHDLDSLISVETDEDVQIMMEEHGYLSSESSIPQTRIRLFLFPSKPQSNEFGANKGDPSLCKAVTDLDWFGIEESKPIRHELSQLALQHPKTETWFVDTLKSTEMTNNSGSSGSGDGNSAICGQESIMLETNSSFGSTSSSVSSTNLPLLKSTSEDNTANSHVKFTPTESLTSNGDNTELTSISSYKLPTHNHVLENKPVPIPVSRYPSFLNQAQQQQQHIQVIYTGNSPATIHYQFPPQPYPIYYIPVEPYNHQVGSSMVHTSSLLAPPELAEASLDDDINRAQIYKSQPPAPILPP